MVSRRTASRRSVLAVAAVLLLGACGGTEAETPAPSSATPTASVSPSGPAVLEIVERVPVGGEPIGIVVRVRIGLGGELGVRQRGRSEPLADRPRERHRRGDRPRRGRAPRGRRGRSDAVWVSNSEDDTVSRIDPATNEVAATIDVCGAPEGMAADDDGLWVVCEESGAVVRDRSALPNRAGKPIEVGLEPRFVAVAFDSVWVSNYLDSTITRLDPATGEVVAEIDDGVRAAGDGEAGERHVGLLGRQRLRPADRSGDERAGPADHDRGAPGRAPGARRAPCGSRPTSGRSSSAWIPATGEITGTWVVSDQGAINANQLVVEAGGAFWFPLLDGERGREGHDPGLIASERASARAGSVPYPDPVSSGLELIDLRRRFGDVVALDGVSFDVDEGIHGRLRRPERRRQDDRDADRPRRARRRRRRGPVARTAGGRGGPASVRLHPGGARPLPEDARPRPARLPGAAARREPGRRGDPRHGDPRDPRRGRSRRRTGSRACRSGTSSGCSSPPPSCTSPTSSSWTSRSRVSTRSAPTS